MNEVNYRDFRFKERQTGPNTEAFVSREKLAAVANVKPKAARIHMIIALEGRGDRSGSPSASGSYAFLTEL